MGWDLTSGFLVLPRGLVQPPGIFTGDFPAPSLDAGSDAAALLHDDAIHPGLDHFRDPATENDLATPEPRGG